MTIMVYDVDVSLFLVLIMLVHYYVIKVFSQYIKNKLRSFKGINIVTTKGMDHTAVSAT